MFKCNSDRASRGNPNPIFGAYCMRNKNGDLIFVEGIRLKEGYNCNTEVVAFRMGLEYCV